MERLPLEKLRRIDIENINRKKEIMTNYKVYYGWTKLNRIRKRKAISIIFENEYGAGEHIRSGKTLRKLQSTVYVRKQTKKESLDAKFSNRVFTEYSIFLDDKFIGNSLERALIENRKADQNNVSRNILDEIEIALRKKFMADFPNYKEPVRQLYLNL